MRKTEAGVSDGVWECPGEVTRTWSHLHLSLPTPQGSLRMLAAEEPHEGAAKDAQYSVGCLLTLDAA